MMSGLEFNRLIDKEVKYKITASENSIDVTVHTFKLEISGLLMF